MASQVRVLILGTGGMAENHATAYAAMPGVQVVAGVDRNADTLQAFCNAHDIEQRFTSLDDALIWGEFDAVSNVTPDGVHCRTTLSLIAAGKHVLCEKPLAVNYADARDMADKACAAGVVNMVNLSYRDVPALQQAASMVADGCIGEIRHFEASYLQSWLTQPAWGDWRTESQWLWRLSTRHGSNGVVGDVGVHVLDFATFVIGSLPDSVSARVHTFDKAPGNVIGEYVLDANDSFVMHVQMPNGALGTISATRFATGHMNDLRLRLYGEKGGLEVLFENGVSRLNACIGTAIATAEWSEVACPDVSTIYERFIGAIRDECPSIPDFERGAQLQRIIDSMV